MARSRKTRNYAAEYARRTAGTQPGSAARQRARGHGAHLRPPGHTEASYRRQKEETAVLREERGLTTAQRQTIKDWYIARARLLSRRGEPYGAETTTRAEAIANWQHDLADWEKAGWRAFRRVREAVAEAGDTSEIYFEHARGPRATPETVQANFIEELNAVYGLDLNPAMRWQLVYKPKKPERIAA